MKRILPFAILLSISSCTNQSSRTKSTTTTVATPPAAVDRCFRQVVERDTTMLQLTIRDSTVTGELVDLPFEKDQARGPIRGTLTNNQIRADWQRSGEGVTQPYEVVFTMQGDTVTWREGERVEQQGKWVLKNPAEGYQYVLTPVECP